MRYDIYQQSMMFMNFKRVYSGEIELRGIDRTLDEIFRLHNMDDRPRAYEMRSLSVGDIVVLHGVGVYVCKNIGWEVLMEI